MRVSKKVQITILNDVNLDLPYDLNSVSFGVSFEQHEFFLMPKIGLFKDFLYMYLPKYSS